MRNIGFLTILVLFLVGCSQERITPSTTKAPTSPVQTTFNRESGIDLAYFQNFGHGSSCSLASELDPPTQSGVWDYESAYYFYQPGEYRMEVYVFTSQVSFESAISGDDKDLWEDTNDGKMKCSGPGSLCGGSVDGITVCVLD